jgi:hypothetical protein
MLVPHSDLRAVGLLHFRTAGPRRVSRLPMTFGQAIPPYLAFTLEKEFRADHFSNQGEVKRSMEAENCSPAARIGHCYFPGHGPSTVSGQSKPAISATGAEGASEAKPFRLSITGKSVGRKESVPAPGRSHQRTRSIAKHAQKRCC